jgi:hypothetical protein
MLNFQPVQFAFVGRNHYFCRVAGFLLLMCMQAAIAYADETAKPVAETDEGNTAVVVWEFDPYYTDVAINVPLTSTPIPTITSDSEFEIYSRLIEGSAIPRYMLLEASVYPMPVLGTYLKRHTPGLYNSGEIGNSGTNIIESATTGFQEPWAVSAFFGNIANLVRPGTELQGNNRGYTGYLVSAGSKHIRDNVLIDDIWYELEWKIKGKRDYPNDKQEWSFRAGAKFHDNPDITDVAYISIHRNNLDSRFSFLHWVKNTEIDMKLHFSQHDGQMVRLEMILGKKYPIADKNYTPTLNVGFIWSSPKEYNGALLTGTANTVTFVFRPSIEF